MKWLLALALSAVLQPSISLQDIDGVRRMPLKVEAGGKATALFFVTHDCPVSNYYSHEIRRICDDYGKRGVSCSLVYVDPTLTSDQVRKHAADYGHGDYPKIVDRRHELVAATGAEITPTAVIIRPDESIAYRGRIDNFYADFGKPRREVTRHDLRDALDAVLAGKPVANAENKPVGCYIPELKFYGVK
ncbi:MAG TPA: redoxin domain-containing protein [Bryobacteraceae bacterium]|nr:redoxin domain-containing protein [Bryobacteraceae bacterium]